MAGNSGPRFVDHVYHGGCISKTSESCDDSSLVSLFASLNPNGMLILLRSNFDGSGVSSFNEFIHELSVDSDTSSLEYSSGEDSDGALPASPSSQSSRLSWASASANSESHWTEWITFILWWLIFPVRILLWVPQYFMILFFKRSSRTPTSPRRHQHSSRPRISKINSSKDHDVPNRATDRRRGVIEVCGC